MKNSDLWAQYQDYTRDLTAHSRKLAFAGGALCWFFRAQDGTFPPWVLRALLFLVLFFLIDVGQYFLGAVFHRYWIRLAEKRMHQKTGTIEGDYDKPPWLDTPAWICWCIKHVLLLVAYLWLGIYILRSA